MPANRYIPVKGHKYLGRDPETGAIVNINTTEMKTDRARKQARRKADQEVEQLKETVAHLQDDLVEIKKLILQLVDKK